VAGSLSLVEPGNRKGVFRRLRDSGLLLTGNFNQHGYDRTLWYSIDYDRLEEIASQ
jgi:hypothetical protein